MKVLFLDCDGVINDSNDLCVMNGIWDEESKYSSTIGLIANRKKVKLIQKIINETECKIVLSSAWRLFEQGRETVEYYGIPVYDITPSLSGERGLEIQHWLNEHPEVTDYAIVDDDGDMMAQHYADKRFFQTDPDHGITKTIAYRIIWKLNNDPFGMNKHIDIKNKSV